MFILLHQGGWDEFLYFSVPVVLGFLGLRYAEKQAKAKAAAQGKAPEGDPSNDGSGPGEDD